MSQPACPFRSILPALVACSIAGALPGAAAAGTEAPRTFHADQLLVRSLIGRVEVVSTDSADFSVELDVQGSDATPERVRIDAAEGSYAELIVEFPLDESHRFVYPALGRGSASFSPDDGEGLLSKIFGSDREIHVTGDGRGLELWVDITVRVPRGKTLRVEQGVGKVVARDLEASLDLVCHACPIEVSGLVGDLTADTGSGSVSVSDAHGDVNADTGSGAVRLARCEGGRIQVDTGSGKVELDTVDGKRLTVDTGSGGVAARGIGADDLNIDTGSGEVALQIARMGRGSFVVDTGSGGVDLHLPANASAAIVADTGSGEIRFDLASGFTVVRSDEDSAELRVGAGEARIRLDTGSGGIHISQ